MFVTMPSDITNLLRTDIRTSEDPTIFPSVQSNLYTHLIQNNYII